MMCTDTNEVSPFFQDTSPAGNYHYYKSDSATTGMTFNDALTAAASDASLGTYCYYYYYTGVF